MISLQINKYERVQCVIISCLYWKKLNDEWKVMFMLFGVWMASPNHVTSHYNEEIILFHLPAERKKHLLLPVTGSTRPESWTSNNSRRQLYTWKAFFALHIDELWTDDFVAVVSLYNINSWWKIAARGQGHSEGGDRAWIECQLYGASHGLSWKQATGLLCHRSM